MNQATLPIVKVPYAAYNPAWQRKVCPETGACINMDEIRLPEQLLDAEVLTVHFSTGTMRVRFLEKQFNPHLNVNKVVTIDVSANIFLSTFAIVQNT